MRGRPALSRSPWMEPMTRSLSPLAALLLAAPVSAQTLVETLTAGVAGDLYGTSIAITNDWLAVGAPGDVLGEGRVYLYERSGSSFVPAGTLGPLDGTTDFAGFGADLDLEGDELVVTAPDGATPYVFFFEHDGASWTATDTETSDAAGFAKAVALDAGRVVVGRDSGAEVYERAPGGWDSTASLTTSDSGTGRNVDVSGDSIVLGGARVVIFDLVGGVWTNVEQVFAQGDVAILGDRALLGHTNYNVVFPPPAKDGGGAYVYERVGGSWVETAILHEETALGIHDYGQRVALADDRALVADLEVGEMAYFEFINGQWSTSAVVDSHCCDDPLAIDMCGSTVATGFPFDAFASSFGRAPIYVLPFQFSFIGTGLAGTGGSAPVLDGSGCTLDGGSVDLTVTTGLGAAPGLLLGGFAGSQLPFYGGTLWVGGILLVLPHALDGTPGVPLDGTAAISLPLPTDQVLVGVELYFQAGYVDAGAVFGASLSNAVKTTIE